MASGSYSGPTAELESGGGASISPKPSIAIVPYIKHLLNGSSWDQTVDGSSTPVNFDYAPSAGEVFYIEHIIFGLDDTGGADSEKYGARTALTNGTQLIFKLDGTEYIASTMKNNGDILLTFNFSIGFFENGSFGAFTNGFAAKFQMATNITLNGDDGDLVRIKVRDDLTGLTFQRAACQVWRQL
jgi:hypothetical protein